MSENYQLELEIVENCPDTKCHCDVLATENEFYETRYNLGCPDWGPPGDMKCYECGEPVNDNTLLCCGVYDHEPLAKVLGECCVCGAPNFFVYGDCPTCGGDVMHFPDTYACLNTIEGTCDFSIDIEKIEEKLEFDPHHYIISELLCGGSSAECFSPNEPSYRLDATLVFTDSGWDVKVVTSKGEK